MLHTKTRTLNSQNGTVRRSQPGTSAEPKSYDFTRPLVWTAENWATEFNDLVRHPPLHSVVVEIAPDVAKALLELSNTKNRRKADNHVQLISNEAASESYELTGDTIKVSKSGVLLDGQHRLFGCIRSKTNITSHVVFGLADSIFDVLDQGKKRTAADILGLCGIGEPTVVAGAIAWVVKLDAGNSLEGGGAARNLGLLTPRRIRSLALGKMKDVANYAKEARLVNVAYKQPPTMVCGLLYLIGRHDPAVARDFAHEWVYGAKIGRNKNFEVLQERLNVIAHGNNGVINRNVRAALLIQTFNHWHAHIVATPRALVWRKGLTFPTIEFNADKFKARKDTETRNNTSLPSTKHRVHEVLTKLADKKGEVSVSYSTISKEANVSVGQISYVIGELAREKKIIQLKSGAYDKTPGKYHVVKPAVEQSETA